jgi:hypothetical protein
MRYAITAALLLIIAASASPPPAGPGNPPLVPPNAHAFGKSFDEWNTLYLAWYVNGTLGAGFTPGDDTVGKVRFLPLSSFENVEIGEDGFLIFTDEYNITMRPGTPFITQPGNVWGETYDDPNVPADTPELLEELGLVDNTKFLVVLNGKVLLEGTGAELEAYQFGPTYFAEPIEYAEPQPRGPDLNATAAIFAAGVGTIFHPLPVGTHTLMIVNRSDFGTEFRITYHITVAPK